MELARSLFAITLKVRAPPNSTNVVARYGGGGPTTTMAM